MEKRKDIEREETQPTKKAATQENQSARDWQHKLANFDALPKDLKFLIVEQVIASTKTLDEAIQELKNIRLINKASDEFIQSPQTLQWIIERLAHDFSGSHKDNDVVKPYINEETVFNKLLPNTDTPEMRDWLEKQNSFTAWKIQLADAIGSNNLEKLKQLLQENRNTFKKDLNEILIHGETPLINASAWIWNEGVAELLDQGADPNLANPDRFLNAGITPLIIPLVIINNDFNSQALGLVQETIQLLLSRGAKINYPMANGDTLLTYALYILLFNHDYDESNNIEESQLYYDFLKFLLENGANPNQKSADGLTPLFMILIRNYRHPEIDVTKLVALFKQFGADPDLSVSVSPKLFYEFHRGEGEDEFYEGIQDILNKKE